MSVPPSRRTALYIVTPYGEDFQAAIPFFQKLASANEVQIVPEYHDESAVSIVTDAATVYIPLADMIDFERERARLTAELERTNADIARTEGKLKNESFVAKAPAAVVDAERQKLEKYCVAKASLEAELAKLK